jgi:predicted site-specific integrase-resolvase
MEKFVKGKEASKIIGVHQRTLYQWENKGWIETKRSKGNIRLYNITKYLNEINDKNQEDTCISGDALDKLNKCKGKLNISYVRVSSLGQKDDLERQEKMVREKYPKNIIIKDIGSGINLDRRGLRKIIDLAIEGKINELVVAYKDRLTRFGYELIEDLISKYSNGKIIIINQVDDMEPEEELSRDVLQIMNVFVAKMNGLRKYKKMKDK